MPFMHKLSRRLALLKQLAWALPVLALLSCEVPVGTTGPATQNRLARLAISPKSVLLRVNQTTDLTAQGLTATGQMAPVAVSFYVHGSAGAITGTSAPSNGRMVGHYHANSAPGRDSVLAVDTSGVADTSVIVVTPMPVMSVTVSPTTASVLVGQTAPLTATLRDSANNILTGRVIAWTSGNSAVATVSATGVVTGLAAGSTAITATSEGKSGTATLNVSTVPVASVTVTPATATGVVGGTTTFTATLRDSANNILTGRAIAWTSGNTAFATVSAAGVATGVAAGSASIIATSEGKSGTAALTVINVPVASVTVSPSTATITVGATQQLAATTKDSAGTILTGRVVTWGSSNTAVATVTSSGLVTGVASGSATMTATSEGKSATAAITVQAVPPPPPAGVPDPTLLPVASGQAPNNAAYNALNVPGQPAGFSYNDPTTNVRIWKVTSATFPVVNTGAGHDYSEGAQEVSRGWGLNNNTHTIHIITFTASGADHWLVDFTRGVGFSNYRRLTVQPARDLCVAFSNIVGQERILYIHTGSQLVRYNSATMQVENTGYFPLVHGAYTWLQQDKTDTWFAGLEPDNITVWVWNSQTNEVRTDYESWTNEPYLERDGRYLTITSGGPYTTTRVWDLLTNTLGPVQGPPTYQFHDSHSAAARGFTIALDPNGTAEQRYDIVSGPQLTMTQIYANNGGDSHHSGNWIQSDAELGNNLLRQWTYVSGESGPEYAYYNTLQWKLAVGIQRSDGSDQRLLLHHYDPSPYPNYFDLPLGKPSPDGKVVVFNSKMNQQGRWDLFVAEVPLR